VTATKWHGAAIILLSLIAGATAAAAPPTEWDGLQRVQSKRMDLVYLQPGADFRGYSKVIVEPTEVSFRKDWRRDYNQSSRDLGGKVSERDIQDAMSKGVAAAGDIFTQGWTKGGYAVVNEPGPDVLRVRTAVANISVTAPDVRMSARSRTFSNEAGYATLVVEVRDSLTGALLGRAVDQGIAGDNTVGDRTSVSNRGDFRDLVETWARDAVRGMGELKALSPAK
jgi:hypothetical protein